MSRAPPLFPLCVALWLATPALARDLVELPAGRVYSVRVDEDTRTLWIALAPPPGGTLEGLEVGQTPVDVALGNWHDNALLEAFTATLSPAAPGKSPGIQLEVQLAQLPRPGTYDVQLTLQQGQERQLLKLQVLVPGAQLRAQATPLVERVIDLRGEVDSTPRLFTLSETSGHSRVTNLSIRPVSAAMSGDRALTGSLLFESSNGTQSTPVVIPPGGSADIAYSANGDFPVGTARGTVEILSPQLETPLAVTYEVRTRRTRLWIPLLLLVGLLTGYILRTWLKYHMELNQKRMATDSLRLKLEEEQRQHPDPRHLEALEGVSTLLKQLRMMDVKSLSEQLPVAERRFSEACATFEKRQNEAKNQLAASEELLAISWSLPSEAQALLEKAREQLGDCRKALESHDVTAADEKRKTQLAALTRGLGETLQAWRTTVDDLLTRLGEAPLPMRADEQPTFTVRLEQIRKALWEVPLDAARLELDAILPATHDTRVMLRNTGSQLPTHVTRILKAVRDVLAGSGAPLVGVEQSITAWSRQPDCTVEDELEWIISQSRALEQTLNEVTVEPLGKYPDDETRRLIAQRRYVELAALVVKRKRAAAAAATAPEVVFESFSHEYGAPVDPSRPTTATATGSAIPIIPGMTFHDSPGGLHRLLYSVPGLIERLREQPPSAATGYAMAFGALLRLKALRTLIAGIGILAVGYLLFAEKFTGTAQDMAMVFVWGFTIDVTVDTLLDVASKGIPRT